MLCYLSLLAFCLLHTQNDKVALQDVLKSPKLDLAEEIEVIKLTIDKLKMFEDRLRTEGKVPDSHKSM